VCAADKLHNPGTVVAALARPQFPEPVWGRFNGGRQGTIGGYRQVHDRLRAVGFAAPILDELGAMAERLERYHEED